MPPPLRPHLLLVRSQTLTPLLRGRLSCDTALRRPRRFLSARASGAQLAAMAVATTQQPELGVEDAVVGFLAGRRKATEVAHA